MYKTILFDLDGTLLNTTIGILKAVKITIGQLNLPMLSDDILKAIVGPPIQNSFEKYFGMDKETALTSANLFRANYKKNSLFDAQLYPGIIDLLESLKKNNFQIAVATNKSHENAMMILEKFGIIGFCDFAMGSDLEGKLEKSDILEHCINHLGAEKKDCLLIGDSDADALGAQKAQIDFLAVTYGFGFKSAKDAERFNPVAVFNSTEALKNYVIGLDKKNI